MIQAASYCESRQVEYIRFNRLKANSDEDLNEITKGERSTLGGGGFASIMKRCERKKFFRVEKIKDKKETRIYPNISLIKKEVEAKKIENLAYGNKRIIKIIDNDATVHSRKTLTDSTQVSASLAKQTTKISALNDSVTVSERIDVIVTRANPKEVYKLSKHISGV
jgi:hypothetical protein